jgi:hypothetical protein
MSTIMVDKDGTWCRVNPDHDLSAHTFPDRAQPDRALPDRALPDNILSGFVSDTSVLVLKTSETEKSIPWTVLETIDAPFFKSLSNLRGLVFKLVLNSITVEHKFVKAWDFFFNTVCNHDTPVVTDSFPYENSYEVYQLFEQTFPFNHPRFVEIRKFISLLCNRPFYLNQTSLHHGIQTAAGLVSLVRQRIEYHKSTKVSDGTMSLDLVTSFDNEISTLFEVPQQTSSHTSLLPTALKFRNELMVLKSETDSQSWYTVMILFQKWCFQTGDECIMDLAFDSVLRSGSVENRISSNAVTETSVLDSRLAELSRGLIKGSMLSSQCVLAGGSLVICMFTDIDIKTIPVDSDIDLWVFDETKFSTMLNYFESLYSGHVRFLKNGPVTTVLVDDTGVSIQLVTCFGSTYKNPKLNVQNAIYNFDLDYVKAFYDGTSVYVTSECERAWKERRVSTGFSSIPKSRFDKAREKGFEISKEYEHKVTFIEEKKSRMDFYYPVSDMFAHPTSDVFAHPTSDMFARLSKRRRVDIEFESNYVDNLLRKVYPTSTIFKTARDVVTAYEKSKSTDLVTNISLYNNVTIGWKSVCDNIALAKLGRVSTQHGPQSRVVLFENPIEYTSETDTVLYLDFLLDDYVPCRFKTDQKFIDFLSALADFAINQLKTSYPKEYNKIGITDMTALKTKIVRSSCWSEQGHSFSVASKLTPRTNIIVQSPKGQEVVKNLKSFTKSVCHHGVISKVTLVLYGVFIMEKHANIVSEIKSVTVKKTTSPTSTSEVDTKPSCKHIVKPPPVLHA